MVLPITPLAGASKDKAILMLKGEGGGHVSPHRAAAEGRTYTQHSVHELPQQRYF
jgi:hypothetical protein